MGALFQDVDALLYPPAQGEADEGIADSGSAQFGALWSLMHVPCVSVPIAKGPRGLPMGTQVIGAYGDDLRTLQVAAFVERVANPPVFADVSPERSLKVLVYRAPG